MKSGKISLIIESKLEYIAWVGEATKAICASISNINNFPDQAQLCVEEGCANAIKHALHNEAGHNVEIIISHEKNRISFKICDSGDPMSFVNKPPNFETFDPSQLESLPEGGWGLNIMRHVMDDVSYSSVGGTNILTLTKYL